MQRAAASTGSRYPLRASVTAFGTDLLYYHRCGPSVRAAAAEVLTASKYNHDLIQFSIHSVVKEGRMQVYDFREMSFSEWMKFHFDRPVTKHLERW